MERQKKIIQREKKCDTRSNARKNSDRQQRKRSKKNQKENPRDGSGWRSEQRKIKQRQHNPLLGKKHGHRGELDAPMKQEKSAESDAKKSKHMRRTFPEKESVPPGDECLCGHRTRVMNVAFRCGGCRSASTPCGDLGHTCQFNVMARMCGSFFRSRSKSNCANSVYFRT